MNKLSTFKSFLALGALGLTFSAAACTKVPPGYVGIKVNQYGSQKGVEDFPIQTGTVFYFPITTDVHTFPTFIQTVSWTKDLHEGKKQDESITFNSKEGATVNTDIAFSYSFMREKVPHIFVEFRREPEEITDGYVRNQVTDIFGAKKQDLLNNVKADVVKVLEPKGFNVDSISFIGKMRTDPRVEASINAVIEGVQRAQEAENKVKQVEAEARQKAAEADGNAQAALKAAATEVQVAELRAAANRKLAESITPQLIQYENAKRWNGQLPQVTGNATPMITIK